MLEIICNKLKQEIETLNLFSKVAGLVQTVSRKVSGINTNTTLESYPVSCNVSGAECWENGLYKQLVPNSSEKGTAYFELLTGASLDNRNDSHYINYTGKVRLMCFLNLKELNIQNVALCDNSGLLKIVVANKFFDNLNNLKVFEYSTNLFSKPINIQVTDISFPPSTDLLFNKYSYQNEMKPYFLYPYSIFALDLDVKLSYSKGCINSLVLGSPINC